MKDKAMIKQRFSTRGPLSIGVNKDSNGPTNYMKFYKCLIKLMNLYASSGIEMIKSLTVFVTG